MFFREQRPLYRKSLHNTILTRYLCSGRIQQNILGIFILPSWSTLTPRSFVGAPLPSSSAKTSVCGVTGLEIGTEKQKRIENVRDSPCGKPLTQSSHITAQSLQQD